MKNYLILCLILLSFNLQSATNWGQKLGGFTPEKFVVSKDSLKALTIEPAKKLFIKNLEAYFFKLNDQYKTMLKLDYGPFGNKWQMSRFEMELSPLTTIDQLLAESLETKINQIIVSDYNDFIGSEFVQSNHKVFDHDNEIFELKKEIIFLKQRIELMKAEEPKEAPVPVEQGLPYIWFAAILIGSAGISIGIKRSKFI